MALNLGVINALVGLDDSDFRSKMAALPGVAEGSLSKIAKMAAGYLSFGALSTFAVTAVKAFSNLEETSSKFGVVFSTVAEKAEKAAAELRKFYGQSEFSSKDMLSGTGDLLTGFGFDKSVALDMSVRVAKLGADLASFSNYSGGAKGASEALTKGLLGETESMKLLGIVIRQDSDEFKKLVSQLVETKGMTEAQARAEAILQIAYRQSPNAIGDYIRTSDSLANRTKELSNRFEEFQSQIGEHLAPAAQGGVNAIAGLLEWVNNLSDGAQKAFVQLTAVGGGIMLLTTDIGKALNGLAMGGIKGVGGLLGVGGSEVKAKAEAAAVQAAEAEKQAAYARTMAVMAMRDKVAEVRLARLKVSEAQLAVATAKNNLQGAMGTDAQTKATMELAVAKRNLLQAQTAESAATSLVSQKHLEATAAIEAHNAATKRNAVASHNAARAQTIIGRTAMTASDGLQAAGSGAKSFFAALGPIGWALIAITGLGYAIKGLNAWVRRGLETSEDAAEKLSRANQMAQDAQNALTEGGERRASDIEKMERLKKLASYERLNNAEMEEARRLNMELAKSWGITAGAIDEATRKLTLNTAVTKKFQELLNKQRESEIKAKLNAEQAKLKALEDEITAAGADSVKMYSWSNIKDVLGNTTEYGTKQYEDSINNARSQRMPQLLAAQRAIEAAKLELERAEYVKGARAKGIDAEKGKKEREKRIKALDAYDKLEDSRWGRTFENADSYEKLRMLNEKLEKQKKELASRTGVDISNSKYTPDMVAMAEKHQYTAEELEMQKEIESIQKKITDMKKESSKAAKEEVESYRRYNENLRKRENQKRFDETFKGYEKNGEYDKARELLLRRAEYTDKIARTMRLDYEKAYKKAMSDQILTEAEKKQISDARRKMESAESEAISSKDKARNYRKNERYNLEHSKALGGFSVALMNAQLGGIGSPAERTARNTEKSAQRLESIDKNVSKRTAVVYAR